jgi:hypothetical protein
MDFKYYKDTSILFISGKKKDNLLLYIKHTDNYIVDYIKLEDDNKMLLAGKSKVLDLGLEIRIDTDILKKIIHKDLNNKISHGCTEDIDVLLNGYFLELLDYTQMTIGKVYLPIEYIEDIIFEYILKTGLELNKGVTNEF